MSTSTVFLTIQHGKVVLQYDGKHGGDITKLVKGVDHVKEFLRSKAADFGVKQSDLTLLKSSSIDFPDEFTDRMDTIQLCQDLNDEFFF